MFRIYDYTGATELFGAPFVTRPPSRGGGGGAGPEDPPPPIKAKGLTIKPVHVGNYFVMTRNGQPVRVSPEEYRLRLVAELLATVPTLAGFRARWLDLESRRELLKQLAEQNLLPENFRPAGQLEDYDLFDVIAAVAYGVKPRTRAEWVARLDTRAPEWLSQLPRIRLEEVAAVLVGLPSLAEQREVAKRIETEIKVFTKLRQSLETRLAEIDLLPAALLRTAFSQRN